MFLWFSEGTRFIVHSVTLRLSCGSLLFSYGLVYGVSAFLSYVFLSFSMFSYMRIWFPIVARMVFRLLSFCISFGFSYDFLCFFLLLFLLLLFVLLRR